MPVSELENSADKMISSSNMPNRTEMSREFNGVQYDYELETNYNGLWFDKKEHNEIFIE